MRSIFLILINMLVTLQATAPETALGTGSGLEGDAAGSCLKLRRKYNNPERQLVVDGRVVEVRVLGSRGAGGAARAGAALLGAALRGAGYRARPDPAPPALCQLAASNWTRAAVVSPAAWLPRAGCGAAADAVGDLSALAAAPLPVELAALAHAPHPCPNLTRAWTARSGDALASCGFLAAKDVAYVTIEEYGSYIAVLARNESAYDASFAKTFLERMQALNVPIKIIFFETDESLRSKIYKLRNKGKSFLFLYENIWTDDSDTILMPMPPCIDNSHGICSQKIDPGYAVRVGDGKLMRSFAPVIYRIINNFKPSIGDLRQILHDELASANNTIEDIACQWALHNSDKFHQWIFTEIKKKDPPVFIIMVYLCKGDPENEKLKADIKTAGELLLKDIKTIVYQIFSKPIDCLDPELLSADVNKLSGISSVRVSGAVAWSHGEGARAAAIAANRGHFFLFFAGPTTPNTPLGSTVHAASCRLIDVALAYRHFLKTCEWSRVAILSDATEYSKGFYEALFMDKKLIKQNIIVNLNNIISNLKELREIDAHIIILNTNWNITRSILCAALEQDMTPDKGYIWITRDWRVLDCRGSNGWGNMHHFNLKLTRRSENNNKNAKFASDWPKEYKLSDASDAPLLVDAILQLGHAFATFFEKNPSYRSDIQGFTNSVPFSNNSNNEIQNYTQRNPSVILNKWNGKRLFTVTTWQITSTKVIKNTSTSTRTTCRALLGYDRVPDRSYCLVSSGEEFLQRCHTTTIAIATALLIVAVIALNIARRYRLAQQAQQEAREKVILGALQKYRQKTTSKLDRYLVPRQSIKLLHEIGSGNYGRVHFAELRHPSRETVVVAAKEPYEGIAPAEETEFLREACVLAPLSHKHIIQLVGVCVEEGAPLVLMEHAPYLDLQRYLTERRHLAVRAHLVETDESKDSEVSDEELTRFALEASTALEYLASKNIVHRDVRAANCLVDKKRSLKLADFGLARELNEKEPEYAIRRRTKLPVRWMAPESLIHGVFSLASDVWALGVLILEIVTIGTRPFGDLKNDRVLQYVTHGGHPPLPPDTSKHTRTVVQGCWQRRAEARPRADCVRRFLQQRPAALTPALLAPLMPHLPPQIYSDAIEP